MEVYITISINIITHIILIGVYVYKLGLEWGEKKSICNKFIYHIPLVNLIWPSSQPNLLVYAAADGKLFLGYLKTNKPQQLADLTHPAISSTCSPDGRSILTGHTNGSVYCFQFDENGLKGQSNLFNHSCIPTALAWGEAIIVGGSDLTVSFYDQAGRQCQIFDYSADPEQREFTSAAFNPSGNVAVVGSYDRYTGIITTVSISDINVQVLCV